MAKKKQDLSLEELFAAALIPEDEQPYEVPSNWGWVKFGCLAMDMADGPFGSNLKKEHYTENKEVRIIQLSNIGENGWREENTKYTTYEHVKTISRSLVKAGEIVIAKMMPAGRAIIVPNNEKAYVLSSDAIKFVPKKLLNTKYMLYAINSDTFRNQITSETQGITRARTSIGKMKTYAFPLTPLSEQHRIVARLENLFEKLDQAKELVQNALDTFKNRKATILHQAFTGELTRKWREENGVDMDSWEECVLSDICAVNPNRVDIKGLSDDLAVTFVPMTAVSDILGIIKSPQEKSLGEVKKGYTNFCEHDVIFAKITPCMENGKAAIIGELINDIGFGSTEFHVLRCTDRLDNHYLYHLVRSKYFRDDAKAVMTGAVGQQRVPKSFLESYPINLPLISEQEEIARILDDLFDKEQQAKEQCDVIEKIDLIKKAILARAFRGKLGTNDPTEPSSIELLKELLAK